MINTPESTIKFTNEQAQQLEMFNSRLANLQLEITIHSKNLGTLRDGVTKLMVEKKSLEEQILLLEQNRVTLEEKKRELRITIEENTQALKITRTESDTLKKEQTTMKAKIDAEKADLKAQQAEIEADRVKLDEQLTQVAQDSKSLREDMQILSEAIKTIRGN